MAQLTSTEWGRLRGTELWKWTAHWVCAVLEGNPAAGVGND